jgi:hypothetical protein
MSTAVFSLPYFGSIHFYKALVKHNVALIEKHENFQKQTYRNRQYIYGANGKLMLNIPVKHSKSSTRKKYTDCNVENSFKWQELHFKSLESAYRTSPYFEFYEDDLVHLYTNTYNSLFDFNLDCFKVTLQLLNLELEVGFTENYSENYPDTIQDLRHLVNAKTKTNTALTPYHQVFENKYGFIDNLSILDVLFNLGPETTGYLKA